MQEKFGSEKRTLNEKFEEEFEKNMTEKSRAALHYYNPNPNEEPMRTRTKSRQSNHKNSRFFLAVANEEND